MRWSRIKNIIILLLCIVNVFLLALVGLRAWRTRQGERETRTRMVQVLSNSGIEFQPEKVPGAMPLTGWQVETAAPEEEKVAGIVGEMTGVQFSGGRTVYTGKQGALVLTNSGEMELTCLPGAVPLTEDKVAGYVTETLAALGVTQLRETQRSEEEGGIVHTFIQLWEDSPVPELTVRAHWSDGELTGMEGRILSGTGESGTGGESISAPTALVRFLAALNEGGYVCSRITGMYPGYTLSGTGQTSLEPAWFIETDAWPWRFCVDGATGAVTAAQ